MEVQSRSYADMHLSAQRDKVPFRVYVGLIYLAIGFFLYLGHS